jgi:hypothetical protein
MRAIKMKKSAIAIVTVLLLSLSGCMGRINDTMQSWIGHPQSELILKWGPPQSTASDGNGGSILIYGAYVNLGQTPGQIYANGAYTAPQQQGYQRTRMFYVNSSGIIYNWRWQGL